VLALGYKADYIKKYFLEYVRLCALPVVVVVVVASLQLQLQLQLQLAGHKILEI